MELFQCRHGEDDGVEVFEVPEFGEVESDGRRAGPGVVLDFAEQPFGTLVCGGARCGGESDGGGVSEGFDGKSGFLDGRRGVRSSAPAAVRMLQPGEESGAAAEEFVETCRREAGVGCGGGVSEREEDAGSTVGGIFVVGCALVAEPEGQPGTVGTLGAGEVMQGPGDGGAQAFCKRGR